MKPPLLKSALTWLCILVCILQPFTLSAQTLDDTFRSPELRRFASITDIHEAPGGKIYVLGQIDYFDKTKVGPTVRLTAQGGLDKTFKTSLSFVEATVDRTGALIGFTPGGTITRLKNNGTVDKTVSISSSDYVNAFLPLPDGRLLVGTNNGSLFCYTSKLIIDPTFKNSETFVNGTIGNLALQGNKIIISGSFSIVGGVAKNDIARIDQSGVVDNTFDVGLGSDLFVAAKVRDDGKIYFRGFGNFNGQPAPNIIRLNANGTLDKTFRFPETDYPYEVIKQGNKFIIMQLGRIIRLNNNGSIDQSFSEIREPVFPAIAVLSNGEIMVSNLRDEVGYGLGKFKASGTRNNGFRPPLMRKGVIKAMSEQGENIIIAGDFFKVNGFVTYGIARLNTDGAVDETFVHLQNHGEVSHVVKYEDQSLLIGSSDYVEKLNANGLMDESVSPLPKSSLFPIHFLTLQQDEKILFITGSRLTRLNANGSYDGSFNYGSGLCCNNGDVFGDMQSDGKLVLVSYSNATYSDQPIKNIFRIDANGTLDNTFDPGTAFNQDGILLGVNVLNNDDIIASGIFLTDYNGVTLASDFAKIKRNGALDTDFTNNLSSTLNVSFAFRARQFRDKIVLIEGSSPTGPLLFINLDGTVPNDFTLPSAIVSTWADYVDVWSPDPNTLYIMGNVVTTGSTDGLSLVRLKYNDDRLRASTTGLNVYPNPADDYITIDEHKGKLTILSLDGNVKLQTNIEKAGDPVNVSNLPRGRYVLKVVSENKTRTINFIKN
jgi:uncharacterized delta-60 repeat protein